MATGWGRKTWGASDWGDLSNETVSVSGIALSSSIGSETITANADVEVTGTQITSTNAGATGGSSVTLNVTGIQSTFSVGQVLQNLGVPVTSIKKKIGTETVDESTLTGEGWGRDAWGSFAWGVTYSVLLSGQELTITGGEESAGASFTAEITGFELTSTQGSISLKIDQDIFVLASEDQIDASVGSVVNIADANVEVTAAGELSTSIGQVVPEPKLDVDVTGISMTMTLGTFTLVQSTNETATGQQLTGSVGQVDAVSIAEVSGLQLAGSVGSVTATGGSTIGVSGVSATISIGTPTLTSWNEIDTEANNVWQDVDLAA